MTLHLSNSRYLRLMQKGSNRACVVGFLAAVLGIATVQSASAQFLEDSFRDDLFAVYFGAEWRHFHAEYTISTVFDTGFGQPLTAFSDDALNVNGPGYDAGFSWSPFPESGGSFELGVWGAPFTDVEVTTSGELLNSFGEVEANDTAATNFELTPNVATFYFGYRQELLELANLLAVSLRGYAGGRLLEYDLTVRGTAVDAYEFSKSGSSIVPVGGADVRFNIDLSANPERDGGITFGGYTGFQVQGGDDFSVTGDNGFATITSEVSLETGITLYWGVVAQVFF